MTNALLRSGMKKVMNKVTLQVCNRAYHQVSGFLNISWGNNVSVIVTALKRLKD